MDVLQRFLWNADLNSNTVCCRFHLLSQQAYAQMSVADVSDPVDGYKTDLII